MSDWRQEIQSAMNDFSAVCKLAGVSFSSSALAIEFLTAVHRPPSRLPLGKMAVYAFHWNNTWLKIGIAGPKSNARYTSQHYNAESAPSTLAASLLKDEEFRIREPVAERDIAGWIRSNANRANILFDETLGDDLLRLAEAFLHVRLRPKYERKKIAAFAKVIE